MLMKAIFSLSLAQCAANWLQALGISAVVVLFFKNSIFLFIYRVYHTNTKANDIRLGHILQDGICCLWHISGRFLFYPTFSPLWTQDGPTYI